MKCKKFFGIFSIVLFGIVIVTVIKKPSLDRDWTDDALVLPDVSIGTSTIEVQNIRDWRYKRGEVISNNFYNETYNLDKIEKVYFLVNPFGKWEGVGHTFFLFEFNDGKTISISVEARRPKGVDYGAVKGLFNNYEMWYTWGSAADLFSRRAVYHNEDLYMYPLLVTPATVRGLFLVLAQTTESLETKPQFYNTVTSNCTNVLADSSNRVNKGSIPWTWARVFTGYADNKLYELKLIPHDKPFEETFLESRIDIKIKEIIEENPLINKNDFWNNLI